MAPYSPFRMLGEAFRAVQENLSALFAYWAIILPVAALDIARQQFLEGAESAFQGWRNALISVTLMVLESAATALAASVAFSRMGRELDKPLWKVQDDGEAVRRFFPLWFLFSLALGVFSLISTLLAVVTEDAALHLALLLMYVVAAVLTIPLGACIMFSGRVHRDRLGETLQPIANQALGIAVFVLFGVVAYIFLLSLAISIPPHLAFAKLAIHIVGGYCDCVIFAGVWLIYRADRDSPPDEEDFDF